MPTCKNCKEKFNQYQFNNKFCKKLDCQTAKCMYFLDNKKKIDQKNWNKQKRHIKDILKTLSDYKRELQVIFNKFIRLRDKGLNCISCNKPAKKENAGHYRSVGGNPELRFEELNVHLQCEYCNTYLHGNLINYRINLIKKIGLKKLECLESNHAPKKYTIDEIKSLKVVYKLKIKNLLK